MVSGFSLRMLVVHFLICCACLSVAFGQTESEIKEAVSKGMPLIEQGKLTEAIPYLDVMVKASPEEPSLRFIYGLALLTKSKQISAGDEAKQLSAKALEQFKAAKQYGLSDPRNDEIINILSGSAATAETSHYSKNPEAEKLMNQAESNFAQSKYDEALSLYQKALALDPRIYEAALYSGDAYVAKEDWDNAEKSYQKAIAINPNRETAYRYSATPLMKQRKYDQARDRYIEAYTTEPYSDFSPQGLSQWAEATGAKLDHPKMDLPEVKFDATGQPVMAAPVAAAADYASRWKSYVTARIAWRKEKFAKTFPNEKQYRHTLQEEAEAIRGALRSAKEQNLTDSQLDILQKLDDEGLLESYILLAQVDKGIAQDYKAYLKDNRSKLRQYILNYVIHK